MSYQVALAPSTVQRIAELDSEVQQRLAQKLEELALNPRPQDAHLLKDSERLYKVRLGEYRIIYQIEDQPLLVTVIKIAHLKDY
ncbi:MAG: type II toxin-antitoxin system RelE family toxin [Nostoc sp. EfeVER01]|uniref:type II toxin-antitoxin system RelE family toxin n=1 Tax=unclassified Nostoc TaxID=2593658 RepID=UPI002AD36650|nr:MULTISPECIES: type II toxin-antitoxin system RelE/ParE family toxin [unclassified Nostoc]MDZ7947722.1 type II toxin-antitoxin system RelE/ParE family toxin [Nostoc sp. EfeVER01]MDZ7993602.1 type II toxin-antitoxin system RelE/ParE family toxin [Nostoc sp. EspVER01]